MENLQPFLPSLTSLHHRTMYTVFSRVRPAVIWCSPAPMTTLFISGISEQGQRSSQWTTVHLWRQFSCSLQEGHACRQVRRHISGDHFSLSTRHPFINYISILLCMGLILSLVLEWERVKEIYLMAEVNLVCPCVHSFPPGSNYVKVWDILSGGRSLMAFSNHQKTITSICFDGSYQRLLSAGLDK